MGHSTGKPFPPGLGGSHGQRPDRDPRAASTRSASRSYVALGAGKVKDAIHGLGRSAAAGGLGRRRSQSPESREWGVVPATKARGWVIVKHPETEVVRKASEDPNHHHPRRVRQLGDKLLESRQVAASIPTSSTCRCVTARMVSSLTAVIMMPSFARAATSSGALRPSLGDVDVDHIGFDALEIHGCTRRPLLSASARFLARAWSSARRSMWWSSAYGACCGQRCRLCRMPPPNIFLKR